MGPLHLEQLLCLRDVVEEGALVQGVVLAEALHAVLKLLRGGRRLLLLLRALALDLVPHALALCALHLASLDLGEHGLDLPLEVRDPALGAVQLARAHVPHGAHLGELVLLLLPLRRVPLELEALLLAQGGLLVEALAGLLLLRALLLVPLLLLLELLLRREDEILELLRLVAAALDLERAEPQRRLLALVLQEGLVVLLGPREELLALLALVRELLLEPGVRCLELRELGLAALHPRLGRAERLREVPEHLVIAAQALLAPLLALLVRDRDGGLPRTLR